MMAKLWEGLGNKFAEHWLDVLFSPSLLFWALGAWLLIQPSDWAALNKSLDAAPTLRQIAMVVAVLLLVSLSAILVRRLRLAALRWLEGYWPIWLNPLRNMFLASMRRRMVKLDARFQELATKGLEHLTDIETAEYQRLDEELMRLPVDEHYLMPTRLGRILRAAELAPRERYSLDGVICWPRLWLLLPDFAREELASARSDLDAAAEFWLWSLSFLVWTPWAHWMPALVLFLLFYAYRWTLRAAQVYAFLIVATYDVHRFALYQALRWPLPQNPAEELTRGNELTQYLWRGSDQNQPTFTPFEIRKN